MQTGEPASTTSYWSFKGSGRTGYGRSRRFLERHSEGKGLLQAGTRLRHDRSGIWTTSCNGSIALYIWTAPITQCLELHHRQGASELRVHTDGFPPLRLHEGSSESYIMLTLFVPVDAILVTEPSEALLPGVRSDLMNKFVIKDLGFA